MSDIFCIHKAHDIAHLFNNAVFFIMHIQTDFLVCTDPDCMSIRNAHD